MRKSFLSCHSSARTPVPHLLSVLPCHRPPDLTDTARCCHTMKGMTSCPEYPQPSQGTKFKPRGQARQTCRVSEGGGERPHRLCDPALCAVNDRLASSGLRGRDKGSKTCRRAAEPPRGNSESIPPTWNLSRLSPRPLLFVSRVLRSECPRRCGAPGAGGQTGQGAWLTTCFHHTPHCFPPRCDSFHASQRHTELQCGTSIAHRCQSKRRETEQERRN